MLLHRFEERQPSELRRLEPRRSADERNLAVSQLEEMFHGLMHALFIIHANIARVWAHLPDIQKHHCDPPRQEPVDYRKVHLRCQDHDPANAQFQQALNIRSIALRLIICIQYDHVIAEFEGSFLDGLHQIGKEWVGDVRDDQSERAALPGSQVARMDIRCVARVFNRSENPSLCFVADETRLIDDVRDGGRGHARELGYVFDPHATHRGPLSSTADRPR